MEQKLAQNVVFSNHIDNKKSAQQASLGFHEVFGLVRWPKKNSDKKNSSKQPKINYKGQKRAYNIVFLNHITNKKVRSRWVQGTMKFLGWFDGPKKIVTKKTAQMSPKLTIWSKKWPSTFFFHTEKSAQQVGLGQHENFGLV